jgi:hypothetical protein
LSAYAASVLANRHWNSKPSPRASQRFIARKINRGTNAQI